MQEYRLRIWIKERHLGITKSPLLYHIPLLNVVEYLLFSKCPGNLSEHELSEKLGDYKIL